MEVRLGKVTHKMRSEQTILVWCPQLGLSADISVIYSLFWHLVQEAGYMGGVLLLFFKALFKSIKNPKTLTPFKMSKQNIMAQFKPKSLFPPMQWSTIYVCVWPYQ